MPYAQRIKRGASWALTLAVGLGLTVLGAGPARAGLKKVTKKAKKGVSKTASKAAAKAKQAKDAVKVGTGIGQKRLKYDEKMPAYAKGMFQAFSPQARFDWTNAYLMLMAAKVVYFKQTDAMRLMADMGLPAFDWINSRNVEAFVASDDRMVVVSLRGTEFSSLRDFATDLDMLSVKFYGGKAHKGTHRAVSHIWPLIRAAVQKQDPNGKKAVWVTGHSFGGNMALLVTKRLVTAKRAVQGVFTFGQFKVGNRVFADRFATPLYRFANENDPVPYGPALLKVGNHKIYYFKHTGKLYFFDKKGRYREEQTRLPQAEKRAGRILQIVSGGLGQHAVDKYLSNVYGQLPESRKKEWRAPF